MAAIPLALKLSESITTSNGAVKKDRVTKLHRPYSLSDDENEEEEKNKKHANKLPQQQAAYLGSVVSTLTTKETMNLIYTNTFQRSPASIFPPYDAAAFSRFRESSIDLQQRSPFLPSPLTPLTPLNGLSTPPPLLEKIRRVENKDSDSAFAMGSPADHRASQYAPRVFDYSWMNGSSNTNYNGVPDRKSSFESNGITATTRSEISPSYEALMKANYEKMRHSLPYSRRCSPPSSQGVVVTSSLSPSPSISDAGGDGRDLTSSPSSAAALRSPQSKARMKYTPIRDSPFDGAGARSPNMFLSSGGRSTADERKPYHRINNNNENSDLVRSMNLHSTMKYDVDGPSSPSPLSLLSNNGSPVGSHSNIHYNNHKSRHYSESMLLSNSDHFSNNKSRSPSSAFSVIRPHFHRMYSTESGYSSDPSSSTHKLFKPYETFEKSKILSRRHSENHLKQDFNNGNSHSKIHHLSSSNGSSSNGGSVVVNGNTTTTTDLDKEIAGVSKLHVSDEASKETLRAFDAHVEKIMAEKTRLQQSGIGSSPRMMMNGAANHPMKIQCPPNGVVDGGKNHMGAGGPPKNANDLSHSVGGLLGLTRIANEHLGQAIAKEKKRSKNNNCLHLWQFLRAVLEEEKDKPNRCIEWTNREKGEFRLIKTAVIADLWGQSKNRKCMTYEKMARAMRYYYKMKILEKVPHKRLHFRFGEKMLARVLDTNTVKPFRRMSTNTTSNNSNDHPNIRHRQNGPPPPPNGYYSGPPPPLQMLRRNSLEGGLNSPSLLSSYSAARLGSQSLEHPPTPMTPLSPCTPMTPLTPCTPGLNNRTPVIMSRTSNVFFPADAPLPKVENFDAPAPPPVSARVKSTSPLATETTTAASSEQQTIKEEEKDHEQSDMKVDSKTDENDESDSELIVDMD